MGIWYGDYKVPSVKKLPRLWLQSITARLKWIRQGSACAFLKGLS